MTDSTAIPRRVVCAAMRHSAGSVICSPRHWDKVAVDRVGGQGGPWKGAEQGFVDQRGVFMTREEAWKVAEAAGQIIRRVGGDTLNGGHLFSENLY